MDEMHGHVMRVQEGVVNNVPAEVLEHIDIVHPSVRFVLELNRSCYECIINLFDFVSRRWIRKTGPFKVIRGVCTSSHFHDGGANMNVVNSENRSSFQRHQHRAARNPRHRLRHHGQHAVGGIVNTATISATKQGVQFAVDRHIGAGSMMIKLRLMNESLPVGFVYRDLDIFVFARQICSR